MALDALDRRLDETRDKAERMASRFIGSAAASVALACEQIRATRERRR